MWLILLLLILFLILDRRKVLQYNTLLMSLIYVLGIPILFALYFTTVLFDILRIKEDFKISHCVSLGVNLLIAIPLILLLIYILFKMCRYPIPREKFSGDETEYLIACAKRQRFLLWICFPLVWLVYIGGLSWALTLMATTASAALLALNPLAWLFNLMTLGIMVPIILISHVVIMGAELVICLAFFAVYAIDLIITLAMTATLLFRVRNFSGYSKKKNIMIVISMAIPLWSLISLFQISSMVRKISKSNT